jgi:hypothetical protein
MEVSTMKSLELAVKPVAAQIAAHRANREQSRGAFPKDIWEKAVALARDYGVVKVAKAAKLDGRSLRAQLEVLGAPVSLTAKSPAPAGDVNVPQSFVECLVGAEGTDHVAWTIEVESASGDRMRIQAPNFKSSDLPLLIRGLLGR